MEKHSTAAVVVLVLTLETKFIGDKLFLRGIEEPHTKGISSETTWCYDERSYSKNDKLEEKEFQRFQNEASLRNNLSPPSHM